MPLCVVDGKTEDYTIILDDIKEGNIRRLHKPEELLAVLPEKWHDYL
jgi:hypothetical protein